MRRLIPLLLVVGVLVAACDSGNSTADKQRKAAIQQRAQAFSKAERAVPTPKTTNFPIRRALAEFTVRQDAIDHPWYVYILGMNGNTVGYYVAKTVPINACDFLSSTQDLRHDSDKGGYAILSAPSLDGVYYGGSGSSSGCDAWFFFDAATNALVQIRGVGFFSSDQPLRLDAKPIKVAAK